jgi:hypothetical protein
MLRILNVLAIIVLVGSAVYAYSIKYATLYQAEKMAELKRRLVVETNSLATVRAEWAQVANPVRVEVLADQYLGGQVMQLSQIATLASLPDKASRGDEIGAKLQDLGLSEPTNTPGAAAPSATPSAKPAETKSIATKPGAARPATVAGAKPGR